MHLFSTVLLPDFLKVYDPLLFSIIDHSNGKWILLDETNFLKNLYYILVKDNYFKNTLLFSILGFNDYLIIILKNIPGTILVVPNTVNTEKLMDILFSELQIIYSKQVKFFGINFEDHLKASTLMLFEKFVLPKL